MAALVAVERWLEAADVDGFHNAPVVLIGVARCQNGQIVGSEVVGAFVRVRHDGRFGRPRPRLDSRGKVLLEPRFRGSLQLSHIGSVLLTRDAVGAATWEIVDDARLLLHGKLVLGLDQLLPEVAPRPN